MAKFIELTEVDNRFLMENHSICVNCDTITYIEPNGDHCWVRFGYGHQVVVSESYKDVCELIQVATSDTIKTM